MIPSLDNLLSADKLSVDNLFFYMDKDSFCSLMVLHGYVLDKTPMPSKSKTLKFTNKTMTIIFQKVTIDNKTGFNVLMIFYKEGNVSSISFNYDGTFYEIDYRHSDKLFRIVKKISLTRHTDGVVYYHFVVHNSLKSRCFLSSFYTKNGKISEVYYTIDKNNYHLNDVLTVLGRPRMDVSAENNYLNLVNLISEEESLIVEMALC